MTAFWCAWIHLPRHGMARHHSYNHEQKYTYLDFHENHLGHICVVTCSSYFALNQVCRWSILTALCKLTMWRHYMVSCPTKLNSLTYQMVSIQSLCRWQKHLCCPMNWHTSSSTCHRHTVPHFLSLILFHTCSPLELIHAGMDLAKIDRADKLNHVIITKPWKLNSMYPVKFTY